MIQRGVRLLLAVGILALFTASTTSAQIRLIPTPTPAPTAQPDPTMTPPPTTTPPPINPGLGKTASPTTSGTPSATSSASPSPTSDEDALPPGLQEALDFPIGPRTPARSTTRLIELLRPLTDAGVPLSTVLMEGMGRFPVAGIAHYSDDWGNPRFTPKPHLHKGLDIFADFGAPIRAPAEGVVSQLSDGDAGGIAVWMKDNTGTSYYFAHMLERAEGLTVGARVGIGSLLGYVGDSGNAAGGTPHTHMQIHRGGGPIPPKTIVDGWLDEAEDLARSWLEARQREIEAARGRLKAPTEEDPSAHAPETSMLLTLLDPIGGSVALVPSLRLHEKRAPDQLSDRIVQRLIEDRVGGGLFAPKAQIGD